MSVGLTTLVFTATVLAVKLAIRSTYWPCGSTNHSLLSWYFEGSRTSGSSSLGLRGASMPMTPFSILPLPATPWNMEPAPATTTSVLYVPAARSVASFETNAPPSWPVYLMSRPSLALTAGGSVSRSLGVGGPNTTTVPSCLAAACQALQVACQSPPLTAAAAEGEPLEEAAGAAVPPQALSSAGTNASTPMPRAPPARNWRLLSPSCFPAIAAAIVASSDLRTGTLNILATRVYNVHDNVHPELGFGRPESRCHPLLLGGRDAGRFRDGSPAPDCRGHGLADVGRAARRHAKVLGHLAGQAKVLRVVGVGNEQRQATRLVHRVHVVGRREPPRAPFQEEAVVAQMVVAVRDADEEHDPPPQLLEVLSGMRPILDQELGQLQVAGLVAVPAPERGHGRDEMDAPAVGGAVEPLRQEGVALPREALDLGRRHTDTGFLRQAMDHELPRSAIEHVLLARKFGDPQRPVLVADARLGMGAAQGRAGCDKQPQPGRVIGILLDAFFLQLEAGGLELPEPRHRRRRERGPVVHERPIRGDSEAEAAEPLLVVNAQEVIGFQQTPHRPALLHGLQGFPAPHEDAPPAVRGRVEEDAEVLLRLVRVLRPAEQLKLRIDGQRIGPGQPAAIVFEGEHFPAAKGAGREGANALWLRQSQPVGPDLDRLVAHGSPAGGGLARRDRRGTTRSPIATSWSFRPSGSSAARRSSCCSSPSANRTLAYAPAVTAGSPRSILYRVTRVMPARSATMAIVRRRRLRASRMSLPT